MITGVVNALSVDVEEYYHGMEFGAALSVSERNRLPSRVEPSVSRVLDLLAEASVHATFFILGEVAERHRAMVQRIAAQGHEVACHGWAHDLVWRQGPAEFRADIRRTKCFLEDLLGKQIFGYRAPNYSIDRANGWALDTLVDEGFLYDSSIYPIHHDRYGIPDAPRFPSIVRRNGDASLWEFPLGTMRMMGVNFPIAGGGPFRLFPYRYFRFGIDRVNRCERRAIIFYFHPWELDPDQPRTRMPWHHRFRHYVNLHRTELKIRQLLRDVAFAPARTVLGLA